MKIGITLTKKENSWFSNQFHICLFSHKLFNINLLKRFFLLLKIVAALTHDTRFFKIIIIHVSLDFKMLIAGWALNLFVINMHSYIPKLKSISLVVFWSCKNLNQLWFNREYWMGTIDDQQCIHPASTSVQLVWL